MKHIYDKDSITLWKTVLQTAQAYSVVDIDTFLAITTYLMVVRKIETHEFHRIIDEADLPKDYKEEAMTLADKLRQEGIKLGIQKGEKLGIHKGRQEGEHKERIKIAKSAIAQGLPVEQVIVFTGLSRTEIETLKLMRH